MSDLQNMNRVEAWRKGLSLQTWNPILSMESFHGPVKAMAHPSNGVSIVYGSGFVHLSDEQVLQLKDWLQTNWGEPADGQ
jgi:hypothetical protein